MNRRKTNTHQIKQTKGINKHPTKINTNVNYNKIQGQALNKNINKRKTNTHQSKETKGRNKNPTTINTHVNYNKIQSPGIKSNKQKENKYLSNSRNKGNKQESKQINTNVN